MAATVAEGNPRVVMVAAECRGLAKVGGLADVVRDLSAALVARWVPVTLVLPCYDQMLPGGDESDRFEVQFGERNDWPVTVYRRELDGVTCYLLRSEEFFGGDYGQVYIDSDRLGRGPFEDDAKRFAFFSAAVAEFIARHPEWQATALHCHDWHTGTLLVLLRYDGRYGRLGRTLRTLFTIHNLDYQGTRPFEPVAESEERPLLSFAEWFPALYRFLESGDLLGPLTDTHISLPSYNPMRAGILLADEVNTVSPTYAREITRPDDPARNRVGGRGLERDLASRGSHLHGILNGLDYAENDPRLLKPPFDASLRGWKRARRQHKRDLLENLPALLRAMAERPRGLRNADVVLPKLSAFQPEDWQDKLLVVAVTRAVRQKLSILLEPVDDGVSVLQAMLKRDIYFILFGTGELQDELEELNRLPNGLFVCGFDADFALRLYAGGDLFLMPSDFEPCGISQMIAMRYGCLPLVSNVGGLADTVEDGRTGFVYSGEDRRAARQALLDTLDRVRALYRKSKTAWREMQLQAMTARFEWADSAEQYIGLYGGQGSESQ
ncbi:MAG: glycogen synthase [Rudaea sp.]